MYLLSYLFIFLICSKTSCGNLKPAVSDFLKHTEHVECMATECKSCNDQWTHSARDVSTTRLHALPFQSVMFVRQGLTNSTGPRLQKWQLDPAWIDQSWLRTPAWNNGLAPPTPHSPNTATTTAQVSMRCCLVLRAVRLLSIRALPLVAGLTVTHSR